VEFAAMAVQPIKIAILAMGGEGGGVLADWIVGLGEANGHLAQTTSVPGVAQRTGATLYYVELYPRAQAVADGAAPVLALMPMPGDVDVVLASELMEAGRAVQRGLVTPERTTLIASTHRVYAIAEKVVPGDGRVDAGQLLAQAEAAARRLIAFDMAQAAEEQGSVISAVLYGALAGSGTLPFGADAFRATIERDGVGVKASLKAFDAALARASGAAAPAPPAGAAAFALPTPADPTLRALVDRLRPLPAPAQPLLLEGLRRLVDYQDPAYAALYLDRIERLAAAANGHADLIAAAARHLALWMSCEDTIRVADLKTRDTRFARVRAEVCAAEGQIVGIEEFMHPRLQEIAETMPAAVGRWLLGSNLPRRLVRRLASRGRVVRTSGLRGFLLLAAVAGLKRWRRRTLRHALENARIEGWLGDIEAAAASDPALAVEIAACQRLVKGYGDTHERGLARFETLRALWRRHRPSPAALRELREAALADEQGSALAAAMRRHGLA
jgi:indolepyruvate ferredoxin oxidoreductase beta subunit